MILRIGILGRRNLTDCRSIRDRGTWQATARNQLGGAGRGTGLHLQLRLQVVHLGILEPALPSQTILSGDGTLVTHLVGHLIGGAIIVAGIKYDFRWKVLLCTLMVHVDSHPTIISKVDFLRVKDIVLQLNFRNHTVAFHLILGKIAQCHWVHQTTLFGIKLSTGVTDTLTWGDVEITSRIVSLCIILIDTHIWHLLVGDVEERLIVLVVHRISELHLGSDLDTL